MAMARVQVAGGLDQSAARLLVQQLIDGALDNALAIVATAIGALTDVDYAGLAQILGLLEDVRDGSGEVDRVREVSILPFCVHEDDCGRRGNTDETTCGKLRIMRTPIANRDASDVGAVALGLNLCSHDRKGIARLQRSVNGGCIVFNANPEVGWRGLARSRP